MTEPTLLPVDPTGTCNTIREDAENPEKPRPSLTPTVKLFTQPTIPISPPLTLPADPILTESITTSNHNQTSMETSLYEEELYCMPVSYGKTTTIVTSSSTSPCTPSDPLVKQKATWKKLSKPKQNSATSHTMTSVGKKRRSSHANNLDGQDDKPKTKRLKGVADSTQLTDQTVEAAAQPRRSQ